MNWRSLILGLALVLPAAPMTAVPATVDPASLKPAAGDAQAAMWATRFLTRFHYKRVPLDDAMSGEILRRYLESLDGDKLFFTRGDVDGFQHFATSLDEAIYERVAPLTDFIQQQCAPLRQFKPAGLGRHRPGKGTFFVPEQLTLDQLLRDRGAVDRNKRGILTIAVVMNRLGH